jgi:O-antigen ligase
MVFGGLLGVIVVAVIPYGTVDAWWEALFECLVFSLTALWIFEVLFRGSWQIRRLTVLLPMVLLTLYIYLQALEWPPKWLATGASPAPKMLSIDHYQTLLTARKSLALTLFLGLLLLHLSTQKRVRWVVRTIIGIGLASALFGIFRQFLQPADSTGGFVLPFLFYGTGYGQFISPNAFAYLMEMTIGLLAGLILGGGLRRNRLLIYLAITIVVWTALVLSNSRGGLLSLACQAIFVLFVSMNWYSTRLSSSNQRLNEWLAFVRKSIFVRVLAILLLLVTLSVGVLWIGGENLVGKLAGPTGAPSQESTDGGTRKEIWRASWQLIKQNPWTGVGFGAYFLGIPQHELDSGRIRLEQAHCDYLDLAASGGLVGVVLAAWFLGTIIWRARDSFRIRDTYQRAASLGAASAILGVCVHSFVDFGLQLTGIAVVFAALVAILIANPHARSIVSASKLSSGRSGSNR